MTAFLICLAIVCTPQSDDIAIERLFNTNEPYHQQAIDEAAEQIGIHMVELVRIESQRVHGADEVRTRNERFKYCVDALNQSIKKYNEAFETVIQLPPVLNGTEIGDICVIWRAEVGQKLDENNSIIKITDDISIWLEGINTKPDGTLIHLETPILCVGNKTYTTVFNSAKTIRHFKPVQATVLEGMKAKYATEVFPLRDQKLTEFFQQERDGFTKKSWADVLKYAKKLKLKINFPESYNAKKPKTDRKSVEIGFESSVELVLHSPLASV